MIVIPEFTKRINPQAALNKGLVAVFSPQDFRANYQRDSAFGNHASGLCQKAMIKGRMANYFDGANYLKVVSSNPKLLALQCPLTITAWVYSLGTGSYGEIFSQYSYYLTGKLIKILDFRPGAFSYYCSKSDGSFQAFTYSPTPSYNAWHFLHVVVDGTLAAPSLRLGSDLIEQSFTPAALYSGIDTTTPITIGAGYTPVSLPTEFFNGYIGELRVYEYPKSLGELAEIRHHSEKTYKQNLYLPVGGYRWWFGQSNRQCK